MPSLIVTFAGLIGTGKSELSTSVAAALGWPRVSFGDYIRSVARQRKVDVTRASLQALGESIIQEQGWEIYCRSVLAQAHWTVGQSLVLDGLRHSEALSSLKSIVSPMEVVLVLLELDDAIREARLNARDGMAHNKLKELDAHSTEVQVVGVLKSLADLLLDSSRPVSELTAIIVEWIKRRGRSILT
jgi:dephospho-CoA kinase